MTSLESLRSIRYPLNFIPPSPPLSKDKSEDEKPPESDTNENDDDAGRPKHDSRRDTGGRRIQGGGRSRGAGGAGTRDGFVRECDSVKHVYGSRHCVSGNAFAT